MLTPGSRHRIDVYAIDTPAGTAVLLGSQIVGSVFAVNRARAAETTTDTQLIGWAYSPATPAAALVRLDIDGLAGTPFLTNVLRMDINTTYTDSGATLGFSIATPQRAAGTHTLNLELIDPLTLAVTLLASGGLVTT